jgi:hypothetical protein
MERKSEDLSKEKEDVVSSGELCMWCVECQVVVL